MFILQKYKTNKIKNRKNINQFENKLYPSNVQKLNTSVYHNKSLKKIRKKKHQLLHNFSYLFIILSMFI